jgi:tetratricopeptide (TPR) repeat protein
MDRVQLLHHALQEARQAATHGDVEQAVFQASTAAGLAQELGHVQAHAEAHSLLMQHLFTLGRFTGALRHGHLALQAWQQLQAFDQVCETQLRLALALSELGVHLRALQLARGALTLARQHGLDQQVHQAIAMLGSLSGRAGDADDGEQLLLQALSRTGDAHDAATRTMVLNSLLALLLGEADVARARGDAERLAGVAHCAEEPNLFRRAVLRGNVGAALAACGQLQDALALQRSCAQQAADQGFRVAEMRSRTRLAGLWLDLGNLPMAVSEIERLQVLLTAEANAGCELSLLDLRARLAQAKGDAAGAAQLQQQADARRDAHAQQLALLRRQVEAEATEVLTLLAPRA